MGIMVTVRRARSQRSIASQVHRLHRVLSTTHERVRRRDDGIYSLASRIERVALFEIARHNLGPCLCQRLVV